MRCSNERLATVLADNEDTNAVGVALIDFRLAQNGRLIARRYHLRGEKEAVRVAGITARRELDHRYVRLRIVMLHDRAEVEPDPLIRSEVRICPGAALQGIVEQALQIARDALVIPGWGGHHHRDAVDEFPVFLVRTRGCPVAECRDGQRHMIFLKGSGHRASST